MQMPTLSVTEVNRYIKDVISSNIILGNVIIRGEISNLKKHYSGHMYFTLKDENSTIRCVMFKSSCDNLRFLAEDGMKVIIQGRVSVYEKDGSYQLYSNTMQPDGIGSLHIAFEQLKKKLELEGLFDISNKKPIPYFPKTVGIVTSPTGAAVRDIINVITRRNHSTKILVYPVQVQGIDAASQIAKAIDNFNALKNVDVIIVGRGGGSIEELWAFNEEIVARSISESIIPIVSAVGHETDFTISDFVSDLRAPTPSAAAELVVPNKLDLEFAISTLESRLKFAIDKMIKEKNQQLNLYKTDLLYKNLMDSINQYRIRLDVQNRLLINCVSGYLKSKEQYFSGLISKLSSLSPLNIMKRGYCAASIDSKLIKSIKSVVVDNTINIKFIDGDADCTIIKVNSED